MTDLMIFLFYFSLACLVLAALDAAWLFLIQFRDHRRYRRRLCECGRWPFDDWGPVYDADGTLHERFRCFPVEEAA